MPRPRKGARLYLRRRGQSRVWVILDGERQIATGAAKSELGKAEAALARHIGGKPRPSYPRDPSSVTVAEVLAVYAEQRGAKVLSRLTLASGLERLEAFFEADTCASITPARCDEYTEWRCGQTNRRGARSSMAEPPDGARSQMGRPAAHNGLTREFDSPLAYQSNEQEMTCREAWNTWNREYRRQRTIKPSTARRELAVLSAALTWAWRNRVLNEHIPVRLPPKGQPRQRHLTRSEAARLLAGALGWDRVTGRRNRLRINRHLARFILIALYTGTRHRAVLELQWMPNTTGGWVDLAAGVLYRRAEMAAEGPKPRPAIPIAPRLTAHLQRWRRLTARHVIEHNGTAVRHQLQSSWRGARKLAGLDAAVTPHILRHTCASWMLQAGVPMWTVAGVLGATEEVVRTTYGHHATEYLRDAVGVFSRRR